MKRKLATLSAVCLVAACAGTQPRSSRLGLADASLGRQILLTLPQEVFAPAALRGDPNRRYLRRRAYGPPPAVDRTLDQLARQHGIERVEGWPIKSLGVYCEVFEVPENVELEGVIRVLMDDPRIELVQRMNLFETLISRYDDPYADLQPAVTQLGIEEAHRLATGKGVTVAVIDSSIDASHPELRGHVRIRRDLVRGLEAPKDGEVHGTAVAGIIASNANNSEGIVGVAPDVSLAALRACWSAAPDDSTAHCSSFTLAQALELAIDLHPAVINLSLVGPADQLLSQLLGEAIRRGVIVVTADAGPGRSDRFPASLPGVIVARSATRSRVGASGLFLAAPGSEILTTVPRAGYAFLSGSSLAAAHVSGVVALLMELDPSMNAHAIRSVLAETAGYSAHDDSISACGALERLTETTVCSPRIGVARSD